MSSLQHKQKETLLNKKKRKIIKKKLNVAIPSAQYNLSTIIMKNPTLDERDWASLIWRNNVGRILKRFQSTRVKASLIKIELPIL